MFSIYIYQYNIMNVICCYYRINKIENNNVIILGLNKIK